MTINEVRELSTVLLIGLGMFVIGVYLVYVMFGAFNMSRKKETGAKAINEYLLRHLIIVPIMELALMLAIAAYITVIDMNLLYLLSIPIGASIAYFLSPRTIEDYYDHDYTKYEQSIALMVSNLLCLMVVTYYNVPVFVAILVYVGIYYITRKVLTHDLLQPPSHTS